MEVCLFYVLCFYQGGCDNTTSIPRVLHNVTLNTPPTKEALYALSFIKVCGSVAMPEMSKPRSYEVIQHCLFFHFIYLFIFGDTDS